MPLPSFQAQCITLHSDDDLRRIIADFDVLVRIVLPSAGACIVAREEVRGAISDVLIFMAIKNDRPLDTWLSKAQATRNAASISAAKRSQSNTQAFPSIFSASIAIFVPLTMRPCSCMWTLSSSSPRVFNPSIPNSCWTMGSPMSTSAIT